MVRAAVADGASVMAQSRFEGDTEAKPDRSAPRTPDETRRRRTQEPQTPAVGMAVLRYAAAAAPDCEPRAACHGLQGTAVEEMRVVERSRAAMSESAIVLRPEL